MSQVYRPKKKCQKWHYLNPLFPLSSPALFSPFLGIGSSRVSFHAFFVELEKKYGFHEIKIYKN